MPILETPPNPASSPEDRPSSDSSQNRLASSRYANLEDHELIHLLDSLDDEASRARFRESVYLSVIICMAVAWFILYGPRIIFHQPQYKDPFLAIKEHEKTLTYLDSTPHVTPPPRTMPDRKLLQQLHNEPRPAPSAPTPQPTQQQPAPEQAQTVAPPVQQPALPLPSAPKPAPAPLVDAPSAGPKIAQNQGDSMQDLIRRSRTGSGGEYAPTPSGGSGPLQMGPQILSDTMGVDFSAYLRRVVADTRRNWDPLIPEEVRPPLMKKGMVGIRFTILPGGQIGAMTLETGSGDVALDKAAWYAITSEGNFPPLPKEFHGPQLELRFGFFYNEPVP